MSCAGCTFDEVLTALGIGLANGALSLTPCIRLGANMIPLAPDNSLLLEGPRTKEIAPINRRIDWLGFRSHLTFGTFYPPDPCGFRTPYLAPDLYIELAPINPGTVILTIKGDMYLANGCVAHLNYLPIPAHDASYVAIATGLDPMFADIIMTCGGSPCTTIVAAVLPEITDYRTRTLECEKIDSLMCHSPCQFCVCVSPGDLAAWTLFVGPLPGGIATASDTVYILSLSSCSGFSCATGTYYLVLPNTDPVPTLPSFIVSPINPSPSNGCPPFFSQPLNACGAYSALFNLPGVPLTIGAPFTWSVTITPLFGSPTIPPNCTLGPFTMNTDDLFNLSTLPGPW